MLTSSRNIAILGATGSIGASALDVIARHPQRFHATALSAHHNVAALTDLCILYQPELAVIAEPTLLDQLAQALKTAGLKTRPAAGQSGLIEAASGTHCDTVLAAIVGAAGLPSTLAAAQAGKRLLLANKESAVMAGPLLQTALDVGGGKLLPIDSEHNALFQCLPTSRTRFDGPGVRRLVLTASGGPFRGCTRKQLAAVTPEQACAHPIWSMGRKISVDSATLMNKGLEVIEAHVLFDAPVEAIDVVVHPQSLVHALVEYEDGALLAELGHPDMRTAISYALAWPERIQSGVPFLDLTASGRLDFEQPDRNTFRCLSLAYEALSAGGDAPAVLNAANEIAVEAFLVGKLSFLSIADLIESVLTALPPIAVSDLDTLVHRDLTARTTARGMLRRFCS